MNNKMNQQTIFNTYVLMQSQSDCDEAKAICEGNGLPMCQFGFAPMNKNHLTYSKSFKSFYNNTIPIALTNKTEVTLTRFKELCEEWKQLNK